MISGGSHKRFMYWHPPEKMCNSRQENTTIEAESAMRGQY
jgi:hypothetical protein